MITSFLSNSIVKGGVAPIFDGPSDYGLEYEDVTFKAADGVQLSGWLVKGGTERVIVQSHFGVQSCRSGYTPEGKSMKMWNEKIHFLKHVKYLVERDYSVLMYDFRNHGDSGAGTCEWVTWGPAEAQDTVAAVDFVANHPDYRGAQIGLLSICMGAAATTYAYGAGQLQQYAIKAMIAVQPMRYSDFIQSMGLPAFLQRWVDAKNSSRVGFDMQAKTFKDDVPKIPIPTLLVQNDEDEFLKKQSIDEFYESLQVEKEMLWLSGIGKKRAAGYDYLTRYPEKVLHWFDEHLK